MDLLAYLKLLKKNLITLFHATFGNVSRARLSSKSHGDEYEIYLALIHSGASIESNNFQHKILNSKKFQELELNSSGFPLMGLVSESQATNPKLQTCIDLGSGTGWVSNVLSEKFNRVIAIEPNQSAIEIAKHYFGYGARSNIEWREGFAENVLRGLDDLTQPTFVVTGVVLSHIPNRHAKKILKYLNTNLQIGSVGLLNEAWGKPRSERMWHVRSKKWWENNLSNCELDFFGLEREGLAGEFLGIKFKKVY